MKEPTNIPTAGNGMNFKEVEEVLSLIPVVTIGAASPETARFLLRQNGSRIHFPAERLALLVGKTYTEFPQNGHEIVFSSCINFRLEL